MRPRLSGLFVAAVVVLVAILIGWGFASLWTLRADFDESQSDVAALREQLLDLGQTPAVDPPRGERGDQGDRGDRGPAGRDGRDGRAGEDGVDGEDGLTPPCFFAPTQCVGAPGRDGRDGTDGVDGADGADSTVPGPPGPQGPAGPGPQSFTFTWANRTYQCSDSNQDGHYECTDNDPVPA